MILLSKFIVKFIVHNLLHIVDYESIVESITGRNRLRSIGKRTVRTHCPQFCAPAITRITLLPFSLSPFTASRQAFFQSFEHTARTALSNRQEERCMCAGFHFISVGFAIPKLELSIRTSNRTFY